MLKIFKILLIVMIIILFNSVKKETNIIEYKSENPPQSKTSKNDISNYFEIPQITNILSRNKITLNGKWNYIVDVQETGLYNSRMIFSPYGFYNNRKPNSPEDLIEYNFDKAPEMDIPSDWNTKDPKLFFYEGTVWFKKSFNYNKKGNKKYILYFGAINYEAFVFINGKFLGKHEGGFTPFNYDITNTIKNGDNFIIIKVNNQRKEKNIPTLIFDWWNYGGITRDVYIVETEQVYIQNYNFYIDKNLNSSKQISFNIELNIKISQKIEINIPELKINNLIVKTDSEGKIFGNIKIDNIELWSPENPKLYNLELKLDKEIIKDNIGFRVIETSDKKIILNGKPIFLRGICIHDEKLNGGGRANSPEDAKKILSYVKELGCNFIRLAHYPHNEYIILEAEKNGIMVWSEVPVYWTINFGNLETLENAKRQLKNMIIRDNNRANIIIWSIANETPQGNLRDNFLSELSKYCRNLDNTRLISMAMQSKRLKNNEYIIEDNMNKYVDVISFNQYMGWYSRVKDFSKINFKTEYNKPVIVSEFGGGAKYGFHGEKNQRWTEEFQENVYIQNLEMINRIEGLSGTTPWILKDFRSPRRVLNGIQDYYNMKGIISDKGEKKKAFYIMKDWYEKKRKQWN